MIHSFSAQNFYSFKDRVTVDLTVDNKAPRGDGAVDSADTRVSLLEAVIGPNASGKTTALKALAFIKWFLVDAYRLDRKKLPYEKFIATKDKPTEFSVTFEIDGTLYTYEMSLTKEQDRVLYEELRVKSQSQVRSTYKKLFSREWVESSESYRVIDRGFQLPWNYEGTQSKELGNSSLIGAARRFGHEESKKIAKYWQRLQTNVDINDRWVPYQYRAFEALEFYENHKESKVKAENTVKMFDLGIDSFDEDGYINHDIDGEKFRLRVDEESSGTQQLLAHSKMIDTVLENGGIAIMDEFDAYLHPKMFIRLLEQFTNPTVNKKSAQLLLSTHDVEILTVLKKYQVLLAQKSNGATHIKRLDSEKGIRNSDNFRAKYMAGEYAALPRFGDEI